MFKFLKLYAFRYLQERLLRRRRARLDRDAWNDVFDVLRESSKVGRWETTSSLARLIAVRRSNRLTWYYRFVSGERIVKLLTPSRRTIELALGRLSYDGSLNVDTEVRELGDFRMLVTRVSLQPHVREQESVMCDTSNPRKAEFYMAK